MSMPTTVPAAPNARQRVPRDGTRSARDVQHTLAGAKRGEIDELVRERRSDGRHEVTLVVFRCAFRKRLERDLLRDRQPPQLIAPIG
jgi:hypothetical protein